MKTVTLLVLPLFAVSVAACGPAADKGPEDDVPADDGKLDSHQKPTDHGDLPDWGTPVFERLSAAAGFHAWQFTLYGDARVTATTGAATATSPEVDTVVYFYKQKADGSGWGAYIARNDDFGDSFWSQLSRQLGAGRYRVLVKGYSKADRGRFALNVSCDGDGCTPPPADGCLFGDTYSDLQTPRAGLEVLAKDEITAASWLGPLEQAQVVLAVRQSSHTDVTTAAEAFARVDQGEINRTFLYEPAARRSFVVYEYGAGDNSYGAYFERRTTEVVASIHDGDLYGCKVRPEVCLLPESYQALLADPKFSPVSNKPVTQPSHVIDLERAQVIAAVARVYDEVTTIEQALEAVDEGSIRFTQVFYTPTNTDLTLVEFGAGDTSVGTIFFWTSLQPAALIDDGSLDACGLFGVQGGRQEGEDCRGKGDCGEGLVCTGVFAGLGKCVNTADVPGEDAECDSDAACGSADLVCAGRTRGYGMCRAAWMRGTFSDVADAAIPGTLARAVAAYGLATVDTDVEPRITIHHPKPSQLRVTLSNPAGSEVLVYDGQAAGNDDSDPYLVLEGPLHFSGDESVNGEWTLRVVDKTGGSTGRLVRWDLTLTSRWD